MNNTILEIVQISLPRLGQLVHSVPYKELKNLQDHYWLMQNNIDLPFPPPNNIGYGEIISVMDLVKSDISKEILDEYYRKYEGDKLDLFIQPYSNSIKNKLYDTMKFAIEKVFKETPIILIRGGTRPIQPSLLTIITQCVDQLNIFLPDKYGSRLQFDDNGSTMNLFIPRSVDFPISM